MSAIGGENVTTTVEGRARFPVNVRYPRDLRSDLETLGRVLVMTPSGAQVPLAQVADIRTVTGPSMIRNENGLLVGYVYVDITGRDVGGYVEEAKRAVAAAVKLPSGYALEWSGQYENMQRVTRAAEARGALHALPDPLPALRQHEVAGEDADRRPRRALLASSARCGSSGRSTTTSRSRSGWA